MRTWLSILAVTMLCAILALFCRYALDNNKRVEDLEKRMNRIEIKMRTPLEKMELKLV